MENSRAGAAARVRGWLSRHIDQRWITDSYGIGCSRYERSARGGNRKRVATYQNGSPTTIIGPPTSGTRVQNEFWRDALGGEWRFTAAGTPGTWMQIRPAAVTADPASGMIPTGYLILNVTTGHIERHAGGYVWEIPAA